MRSRLTILAMLVFGMLLSTTGAGLAVSGLNGKDDSSAAQYGETKVPATTPKAEGDVLGEEDRGSAPRRGGAEAPAGGAAAPESSQLQPARQVEAGAGSEQLPFTGLAALPILMVGAALLGGGLVLRRRARG